MSDKHARWKQLEMLLAEALDAERSKIAPNQADLIAEFIDHNEFGLAFDQLEYSLDEAGLPPTEIGAVAMAQAADLMRISRAGELGRACR